jgi:hypothetical protein
VGKVLVNAGIREGGFFRNPPVRNIAHISATLRKSLESFRRVSSRSTT